MTKDTQPSPAESGKPQEAATKNLSEKLFTTHKQAKETSALTRYLPTDQAWLDERHVSENSGWYRGLRRMQWIWQGVDPLDQEEVLAKIAGSDNSRTHDFWLDTVMGYRSGNWAYEWTKLGAHYQKEAVNLEGETKADKHFSASLCYSIAGYPHLKSDNLSVQAQVLANAAYDEGAKATSNFVRTLKIPFQNRHFDARLHVPHTQHPFPVVVVSAGLDSLQTDMWRLYRDYLRPRGIGMITVDMPSVGACSHWTLNEDSSEIHQAVLNELPNLPWVSHNRVGLLGFRFGGNSMIRLSFLEQEKVSACVAIGAPVHKVLSTPESIKSMPKMYLDMLASRLGKTMVDVSSLSYFMMKWSLKVQGIINTRRTKVPILAMSMENDPICPESDNQLVALYSLGGKAKKIKSDNISKGYEQSLELAIKWMESELLR
ncbi:esterase FrsA [Vibrio agarivorans]|uniref:esterase FrsA n=1 Tax=Vibrio agarivorans TaxID=153622 RepID=UPI0022327E79|nr:esterase FrsA [Vibrio agarivorans]MDN3662673.1 esterase FrsA [Vibrio agarivorans]